MGSVLLGGTMLKSFEAAWWRLALSVLNFIDPPNILLPGFAFRPSSKAVLLDWPPALVL